MDDSIFGQGDLAILIYLTALLSACIEWEIYQSDFFGRDMVTYRVVELLYFSFFHHGRDGLIGFFGLGEEDKAAGLFVYSMIDEYRFSIGEQLAIEIRYGLIVSVWDG